MKKLGLMIFVFECIVGHNEFDNDPISTFKKEDFFEMIDKIINIEGKLGTLDNLNAEGFEK
jgi:hypothetical protein